MNNLYNQLNAGTSLPNNMQQIRNMVNMFRNSNNPQALVQNMLQNNPQVRNIIQQSGGDPKTAFYNLAKQKGINPDEILNMLR